jgi:hypothetical protein
MAPGAADSLGWGAPLADAWACKAGRKRSRADDGPFEGPACARQQHVGGWSAAAAVLRAHNPPVWVTDAGRCAAAPADCAAGGHAPPAGRSKAAGVACPCGWRGAGADAFAQHAAGVHGLPRYIAAKLAPLQAWATQPSLADCS